MDTFINLFLTTGGAGTGNLIDYYNDVTYGAVAINTDVRGWYDAPFPKINGLNRRTRVEQCANAIPDPEAADMDFSSYWGIITVMNNQTDAGDCHTPPHAGPVQIQIKNHAYLLGCEIFDWGSLYTAYATQEVGHGLGMPHSFDNSTRICGGQPGEYCDQYDEMSNLAALQFLWPNYPPEIAERTGGAGPGLNVPNLLFLRAIPNERIATYGVGSPNKGIPLRALSHPLGIDPLAVKIVGNDPSTIFTVEYRQADGWDKGLPNNVVLVHMYKQGSTAGNIGAVVGSVAGSGGTGGTSPYSYLIQNGILSSGGSFAFFGFKITVERIDPSAAVAYIGIGPP